MARLHIPDGGKVSRHPPGCRSTGPGTDRSSRFVGRIAGRSGGIEWLLLGPLDPFDPAEEAHSDRDPEGPVESIWCWSRDWARAWVGMIESLAGRPAGVELDGHSSGRDRVAREILGLREGHALDWFPIEGPWRGDGLLRLAEAGKPIEVRRGRSGRVILGPRVLVAHRPGPGLFGVSSATVIHRAISRIIDDARPFPRDQPRPMGRPESQLTAEIPDHDPNKTWGAEPVGASEATGPAQGTRLDDSRPRSTSPRILLVEDNPFNRRVGSVMLERFGCQVVVAEDGDAAIARYREGEFDLVLMDVQLPGMDGLEATARIRALQVERNRDVPIVALTAEASLDNRRRCLEAGMDGCLGKPMAEAELRRLVAESHRGHCPDLGPSDTSWGLDPSSIRAMYPMSDEAMANVIGLFRESCVERLRQMAESLDQGDATLLAKAAHALRGSLAMFAASNTIELVASLERLGKDGRLDGARESLGRLEMAIEALQPTLDHLLPVPC